MTPAQKRLKKSIEAAFGFALYLAMLGVVAFVWISVSPAIEHGYTLLRHAIVAAAASLCIGLALWFYAIGRFFYNKNKGESRKRCVARTGMLIQAAYITTAVAFLGACYIVIVFLITLLANAVWP